MKLIKRLWPYWCGWLSLAGCVALAVSFAFGEYLSRWQQFVYVGVVAVWTVNWMLATRTGRTYELALQRERQRSRSIWS